MTVNITITLYCTVMNMKFCTIKLMRNVCVLTEDM